MAKNTSFRLRIKGKQMSIRSFQFMALSLGVISAVVFVAGCSQSSKEPEAVANSAVTTASPIAASSDAKKSTEEEHPHIPGAHGGIIIPIGSDSYHAEAVLEKDGQFRLLLLGADESRIQEVDIQSVKAYVKASGESDATPIDMKAVQQDGDAEGQTSQFVGKLPDALVGQAIDVTIPNLRVAGERFRIGFTTKVEQHDNGMPAAVTGSEEQELYFTAAGKYTEADIQANGPLPAGEKFRGFMSKHDMSPKPGDLICPVTFTKANSKIEWQVNGKKYLFCCPPCVDEFVRMAKEEPDEVKEPEDYVQGERGGMGGSKSVKEEPKPDSSATVDPEVSAALAKLNDTDRAVAESQKFCAVMTDSVLGSMGTPIKVDVNGEPVFLCCKGCKSKALRNPEETLAMVAKLKQDNLKE
jgi:YHS domain-containing protein